jgi:glycolate oxidase
MAEELEKKHGVLLIPIGHVGDGNLHYNIIKLEEIPDDEWQERMESTLSALIDMALEMGGTISGEHGLGYTKKHYLERQVGQKQIELMKGIKKVFDPNNIMNPGKVFP